MTYFFARILKVFLKFFYRYKAYGCSLKEQDLSNTRCIILLNHTSLFEFLALPFVPNQLLRKIVGNAKLAGADTTFQNMPFIRRVYQFLSREAVSISRKRDQTWNRFIESNLVKPIWMLAPEGRMKRPDGFDKNGLKMTVKGGIADILSRLDEGNLLVGYSGGLHHIAPPGHKIPRIGKTIQYYFEVYSISQLNKKMGLKSKDTDSKDWQDYRKNMIHFLEKKRDTICCRLEDSMASKG